MRHSFIAESLVQPLTEERIAPGGRSSSRVLNRYFDSIREELLNLRDRSERQVEQLMLEQMLQTGAATAYGSMASALRQMLHTLLQTGAVLPVDFYGYGSGVLPVQIEASTGMMHPSWGVATAPVTSEQSVLRYEDGSYRKDLQVQVAVGSSEPDGTQWLYTQDVDDMVNGKWLFRVPDSAQYILVRIGLSVGALSAQANTVRLGLLPAGLLELVRVQRRAGGSWVTVPQAAHPWETGRYQWFSRGQFLWDPSGGATDAVQWLFRRNTGVPGFGAIGLYDVDLLALRFAPSGSVFINLPAGSSRPIRRVEIWQTGTAGIRTATAEIATSTRVRVNIPRTHEGYSTQVRGISIFSA